MVSQEARWVLTHTKVDPLKVAQAFGCTEQECWEFLEELNIALSKIEEQYREAVDERRISVQAFVDELPDAKETKRQLLVERLQAAKKGDTRYNVSKLLSEARSFKNGSDTTIDQNSIISAKNASILTLLGVNRVGNISCPFHRDKNPSFQIKKNNTFACYSCGEHGDVIDLYMKLHSCDFKTAVKALT